MEFLCLCLGLVLLEEFSLLIKVVILNVTHIIFINLEILQIKLCIQNKRIILFDIVPQEDLTYQRLPWANNELSWSIGLSIGPLAVAFLFGLLWSIVIFHKIKNKNLQKKQR